MRAVITVCILVLNTAFALAQTIEKKMVLSDSILLRMEEVEFELHKHQITIDRNNLVILVDGKPVFGTDATIPRKRLSSFIIEISGIEYDLSTDFMYDPELYSRTVDVFSVRKIYSGYLVRALFGLGAGTYGIEWTIINNSSFMTMITSDRKVLDNW